MLYIARNSNDKTCMLKLLVATWNKSPSSGDDWKNVMHFTLFTTWAILRVILRFLCNYLNELERLEQIPKIWWCFSKSKYHVCQGVQELDQTGPLFCSQITSNVKFSAERHTSRLHNVTLEKVCCTDILTAYSFSTN